MIKPPTKIDSWQDWPKTITHILRNWNHSRRLRFEYHKNFICVSCEEFCLGHRYADAVLDGRIICDDCLIKRAEWYLEID